MLERRVFCVVFLVLCVSTGVFSKGKHHGGGGKQGLKFLKSHRVVGNNVRRNATSDADVGLWPSVFNLATKAVIAANATCGEGGREEFCRMAADNGKGRCGICDNFSPDQGKRHSISYAIDGTNRWWQSPALYYGPEYEYVTITVDLKQVYQITYVILKAANSPRPGTWVLERSIDGEKYEPWQYFARSNKECMERFGLEAIEGKPRYSTDSEVICTAFYSRLTPLENGEIHTSLILGRPGANESSPELLEFTKTRFVRFRFMGLRGTQEPLPRWFTQDIWRDKKLFYSIRDISIGGQCVCNGHAENCRHNVASGHPECECSHHTCGPNCDRCCPLYNQREWAAGTSRDAKQCLPCNCHGHATSCHYDEDVDRAGLSLDVNGNYQGGGVCDNCMDYTTGINCEQCINGYFRSEGTTPDAKRPCTKCECDSVGSTGSCVQYGKEAGKCECHVGYTGDKCDTCSEGYRGYPNCELCPCDSKGTAVQDNCEGECTCKVNVEGKYCDRCKSGYFGLSSAHPDGCLSCYCSGVTTLCEVAIVKQQTVRTLQDWLITDLTVSRVIKPTGNGQSVFSVGNYKLPGVVSLYWLAPQMYVGNKLEAYGSVFHFVVQWVVMRGDTSGEATEGPNIVMVGENGLRIATGNDVYYTQKMSFDIPLTETDWYLLPANISDITTRQQRKSYIGRPVTRRQFLSVLADVKYVLLRGTYHTDQIEGLLEEAHVSYGSENGSYVEGTVERCSCPSGYAGLSCEKCSFGYVRITPNGSNDQSFCGKCDCNGHSETCNQYTGECSCEHNTIGEKCERCAVGYYGNPLRGTAADCKRCACPLENDENNFSPSCQLDFLAAAADEGGSYVCTQCPKGYTGDHCEICDDGFYGDPLEIGNSCRPCDCNGGPCDSKTGQCLSCKGNTEGWKCERCKQDYYGDPSSFNCKSCECDSVGSETKQCDNVTGQCVCKEKFVGRTCDRCEEGYGNVSAYCQPCSCNPVGSKSPRCDGHTGVCECLAGVDGFHCDTCQNFHYGFSENGCQPCNCDPNGSKYLSCDPNSGNCICKSHYEGRTCNVCKTGYWKDPNKNCVKCNCSQYGAKDNNCNQDTGQCSCYPGIGGATCDGCLPNHYGSVENGCEECELCTRKGHVCGKGGKCVCPELTIGGECERCSPNAWGYEPGIGCKACNCSVSGSSYQQCNKTHGLCTCKLGYAGEKCNRCADGYYGYPNCKKCQCDPRGVADEECFGGECRCNEDGSCNCKENVQGTKCNTCKYGTFGLTKDNPVGCTKCFCFGRSTSCVDTMYNWDKIRFEKQQLDDQSFEARSDVISLPKQFIGDLTSSYDAYFSVNGTGGRFEVFLTGNDVTLRSDMSHGELKLNEKHWKITSGAVLGCDKTLTRECLMVVLQNVTSVVVEGQNMEIREILLDKAMPYIPYNRTSHSIEKCDCPPEYSGLSCQDPNRGYYRHRLPPVATPGIDAVVGVALPCDCNGKSNTCHPLTGHCEGCLENTAGAHCEICAVGYYQERDGTCVACSCPSQEENNALSCVKSKIGFSCRCKDGYTGSKCEKCEDGYFMEAITRTCQPCNCNVHGSTSRSCNAGGLCHCREGFRGSKCHQCDARRHFIKDGVCSPCDQCTQLLFKDVDELSDALEDTYALLKEGVTPPWKLLMNTKEKYEILREKFEEDTKKIRNILDNANLSDLEEKLEEIKSKMKNNVKMSEEVLKRSKHWRNTSEVLQDDLGGLKTKLEGIVKSLEYFGKHHVNVEEALKKARKNLREISEIATVFDAYQNRDQELFKYCDKVSKKVQSVYINPPEIPKKFLDDLNIKLDDLEYLTKSVEENLRSVRIKHAQNNSKLKLLGNLIERIGVIKDGVGSNVEEISNTLSAINGSVGGLETVYKEMGNVEFGEFRRLQDHLRRNREDFEETDELFERAFDHAVELEKTVEKYKGILNFTKEEWKTIRASGAYEEIVKTLNDARRIANDATLTLQNASKIISPAGSDDVIDKANLALADSDRLHHRIHNLKNLSAGFVSVRNRLEKLKYNIHEGGTKNNNLSQRLLHMENQITTQPRTVERLQETIETSIGISETMRRITKEIRDANLTSRYDLFKKHDTYVNLTKEIDRNRVNISSATALLMKLDLSSINFDDPQRDSRKTNLKDINAKIRELQDKIQYARHAADSINVALGLANCSMLYRLPTTEVFEKLAVTYKCSTCHLFGWENAEGDSLTLNVVDHKATLRVVMDTKAEQLEAENEVGSENTILVERLGPLIRIKFAKQSDWQQVHVGSRIFVMDSSDYLRLGDGPSAGYKPYVHKLIVNDHNIGMWNFAQTKGSCTGQSRVNTTENEGTRSFFGGNGYRLYGTATGTPAQFNIRFNFATFDENSLIYMAQEQKDICAYISLSLRNGYLELIVKHSNGKKVTLTTDRRYNDGKDHFAEISMTYKNKNQRYSLRTDYNFTQTDEKLDTRDVFRIKKAYHMVGGVPPTFNSTCVKREGLAFLGYLEHVGQLENELVAFGVTKRSGKLSLSKVWFDRDGYMKLNSPIATSKDKLENIAFVLRPTKANCVVMNVTKFGVVSIADGRLRLDLKRDSFTAAKQMNLDDYNVIELQLKKDKVTLVVNGEEEEVAYSYRFRHDNVEITVGAGENYEHYLGGVSDLMVNNKRILFNSETVVDFLHAGLGREASRSRRPFVLKGLNVPISVTNSMQNTEGCAVTPNYATDTGAVKFGDKPDSYIHIRTSFWKKDYKVSFEFRTFYPDGVLFVTAGTTDQQHYNLLELRGGAVYLHARGRRRGMKNWPIAFEGKRVNDGRWHSVQLVKKNRKLIFLLDGERHKPVRLPKNLVRNEMFLGGAPRDFVASKELRDKLLPFRGCMRALSINGEPQFLVKNNNNVVYQNIRQCFPYIEEGAYFGGDAYAIYSNNFKVNKILELGFEFRTAEQNGVLLSVSNHGNYPALSVELQNGAVVMTIDMGGGAISQVKNNLGSDFALCNDMWHSVTAMYSTSELTVNVDGIRKSWVQTETNSLMEEIDAPLYIGGLPDNAPIGTLKTRENFKGCIRKLKIEDDVLDWTDMLELNKVLLNSCPVTEQIQKADM